MKKIIAFVFSFALVAETAALNIYPPSARMHQVDVDLTIATVAAANVDEIEVTPIQVLSTHPLVAMEKVKVKIGADQLNQLQLPAKVIIALVARARPNDSKDKIAKKIPTPLLLADVGATPAIFAYSDALFEYLKANGLPDQPKLSRAAKAPLSVWLTSYDPHMVDFAASELLLRNEVLDGDSRKRFLAMAENSQVPILTRSLILKRAYLGQIGFSKKDGVSLSRRLLELLDPHSEQSLLLAGAALDYLQTDTTLSVLAIQPWLGSRFENLSEKAALICELRDKKKCKPMIEATLARTILEKTTRITLQRTLNRL